MFAMRAASSIGLVSPGRGVLKSSPRCAKTHSPKRPEQHRNRKRFVPKSADFDLDALMPDSIEGDLEGLQEEAGANFDEDGVPLDYGDVALELETLKGKVGVVDRGAEKYKLLRLTGPAAVPALTEAGASMDSIESLLTLGPNQGKSIAFSEGKVATCYVQSGGLLVIAPASVADALLQSAGDDCMDLAEQCSFLSLVGPEAGALLQKAGVAGVMDSDVGTHQTFGFEGRPVVAINGGGELFQSTDATENKKNQVANLVVDEGVAGLLWAAMTNLGAEPVGTTALEKWVEEK